MKTEHLTIREAMVETVASERGEQALSRRALCDRAGLSNSVLQHFEDRDRDIYLTTLFKVAKALGKPLWQMVRDAERRMGEDS